jgi:hypothetical protein
MDFIYDCVFSQYPSEEEIDAKLHSVGINSADSANLREWCLHWCCMALKNIARSKTDDIRDLTEPNGSMAVPTLNAACQIGPVKLFGRFHAIGNWKELSIRALFSEPAGKRSDENLRFKQTNAKVKWGTNSNLGEARQGSDYRRNKAGVLPKTLIPSWSQKD